MTVIVFLIQAFKSWLKIGCEKEDRSDSQYGPAPERLLLAHLLEKGLDPMCVIPQLSVLQEKSGAITHTNHDLNKTRIEVRMVHPTILSRLQ